MTNVMIAGSNDGMVVGTMGANGTLSEEFDLTGYTLAGLMFANASNGTLSFLVSYQPLSTGTNSYRTLYNGDGTVYSLTLPSGTGAFSATVTVSAIASYRYVRLLASVAQASTPTFRFMVKA